jgi:hypothetical protein
MNDIVNKHEMRFFGIKRSGNHAFLYWIIENLDGIIVHINNIQSMIDDPYTNCSSFHIKGISYWTCKKRLLGFLKNIIRRSNILNFTIEDRKLCINTIRNIRQKDLLILSYENQKIELACNDEFDKKRSDFLGQSEKRSDVLILRDPFNLFSSMIISKRLQENNKDEIVNLWKSFAREFLGETSYLKDNKVNVNYNRWVMDLQYRKSLTNILQMPIKQLEYNNIPYFGGGSSFTGIKEKFDTMKFKVFERWRYCKDNELFKTIFKDEELIELSLKIFGPIVKL